VRHPGRCFSQTSKEDRIALLEQVIEVYKSRMGDIAAAVTSEMGAPSGLASGAQAPAGLGHVMATLKALKNHEFEEVMGTTTVVQEPVGVCAFITPWNWPLNQIMTKVAPALATGCTMVLKPSEVAPLNALIVAEVLHEAGVPAGVFNLVNGNGLDVGVPLTSHPDVDMVSFTGSTRAGVSVAENAAPTVKRVTQELGGKSANVILDDVDVAAVVGRDMFGMCMNTGQSCNAGSRMLVPNAMMDEAIAVAKATAESIPVGDPNGEGIAVGPVVSEAQFLKIQALIQKGIDEGATLVTGGVGRPDGLDKGYFVKPTVFANTIVPSLLLASFAPAWSTSTVPVAISTHRSVATSVPATAASGASTACSSSSKPSPSSAELRNLNSWLASPRTGG